MIQSKSKKALISIDNHFVILPTGEVKCETIIDESFWLRYLDYYSSITVLVRAEKVSNQEIYYRYNSVSYPGVTIVPVPMFKTVKDLVFKYASIRSVLKDTIKSETFDNCIIRMPSLLGYILFFFIRFSQVPLSSEVVADMSINAKDANAFSKLKTSIFDFLLKYTTRRMDGVAYVTKYALQSKYPASKNAITTNYSSINLKEEYFYEKPLSSHSFENREIILLHVSTLNSNAKGHKMFIETVLGLSYEGFNVHGKIVGGGYLAKYYEDYAIEIGAKDLITFVGSISNKNELRDLYIESDILLFPTEFEGLPRTIIEAMACSLPVVSSAVGGIPELLSNRWIGDAYDKEFFLTRCKELISSNEVYRVASKSNFVKAHEYEENILQKRRYDFFKAVSGGCK